MCWDKCGQGIVLRSLLSFRVRMMLFRSTAICPSRKSPASRSGHGQTRRQATTASTSTNRLRGGAHLMHTPCRAHTLPHPAVLTPCRAHTLPCTHPPTLTLDTHTHPATLTPRRAHAPRTPTAERYMARRCLRATAVGAAWLKVSGYQAWPLAWHGVGAARTY